MEKTRFLETKHGKILLPVFMPVGTQATVKSLTPSQLNGIGAQIILANTYHLFLRPGLDVIKAHLGLHNFMNWNKPILTDSGGFQVFSLAKLRKITKDGVWFNSHIDGRRFFLSPELSMEIQDVLNSDIRMVLDECPPGSADYDYVAKSLELTTLWAKKSKNKWETLGKRGKLFGIVQGGLYENLRRESFEQLLDIGFDGYAIGGLSVGESKEDMYRILAYIVPFIKSKTDKPIYLMGVGDPKDIVYAVNLGVDMFDCVLPTRNARNGQVFVFSEESDFERVFARKSDAKLIIKKINIKQARYIKDTSKLDTTCDCYTCRSFTKAYLNHLFKAKEILYSTLATIHNLHFFMRFMDILRLYGSNVFDFDY